MYELSPNYGGGSPNSPGTGSDGNFGWEEGTATTLALLITFAVCLVMLIFIVTCVYLRVVLGM